MTQKPDERGVDYEFTFDFSKYSFKCAVGKCEKQVSAGARVLIENGCQINYCVDCMREEFNQRISSPRGTYSVVDRTAPVRAKSPMMPWTAVLKRKSGGEEGKQNQTSEFIPDQLRTREANTHLKEILEAARRADESAAVLRHTSYEIKSVDELKLHTSYIRTQARHVISLVDELMKKIESGEIKIEDFQMKKAEEKGGE